MTICNMSIEGGARVGYVNPDETTFALHRGPAVRAAGRRRSTGRSAWWRSIASDADAVYDDEVVLRRAGARTDGDLGHQSRPVGGRQRADSDAGRRARRRARRRGRSARVHGIRARRARSRARRSTWRSSARAPTARLSDLREAARIVRGQRMSRRTCKALVVPGLAAGVERRPRPRGSTRSSATPVSSGAAPGARCASA